MDERLERQARNEAMFRAVNREIESEASQLGEQDLEVLCECGRSGCSDLISITAAVYDEVHNERDRFLVTPGHDDPQLENVVKRTEEWLIVDKFGAAERIVEAEPDRPAD
jgi:hypothetical protein